ncbi:WxL domain-containing protein [Lacticaseibacillus porcinae]|uniref:WxL domain-containing protein n=1 Tax=Lacticaseibacillus porcinae TaxID=1123687 RepID=UPI000F77DBE0|nr:WxL domain-containing protein [Lacticaseibacillus porcinae]
MQYINKQIRSKSWRLLFSAGIILIGCVMMLIYFTHNVVGLTQNANLTITSVDDQATFSPQKSKTLTLTNAVDPTQPVTLKLPQGVSVDWTVTKALWGVDHQATATGESLIADDQTLTAKTEQGQTTLTFTWPKATAMTSTAKMTFALSMATDVKTVALAPTIGTATIGTTLNLVLKDDQASIPSSASAASGSSSASSIASPPTKSAKALLAPAPTADPNGVLTVASGNSSYIFADDAQIPVLVTNTKTPGAAVTIGLGGTTLDWGATYRAWKAWDDSTTSNDSFTELTTASGASLKVSTQNNQQVLTMYLPTAGAHANTAPFTVKPTAGLANFTLTPQFADGTKGQSQKWTHMTMADPDSEESMLYAWLEKKVGNKYPETTNFAVGDTGVVETRFENLDDRSGIVQLAAATTLDFSATTIEKNADTTITKTSTTTGNRVTYTYTIVETSTTGISHTSHVTVIYDQTANRIYISSPDNASPVFKFFFTVNSGGGNSGYMISAYMSDGSDGQAWTMNVTGDVTPAEERVQIHKVDASNPETNLSGATFTLKDTNDTTDSQQSTATNDNGLTTIVPKNSGVRTLQLTETTAPPGYNVSKTVYEVQWSKLTGITKVRQGEDPWDTTTKDGMVSVKDNQILFKDSKTGQITVQAYDRSTDTMLSTQTYIGDNGQSLSTAHPGANVPATHEGLTIWGSTMGDVTGEIDPYDPDNLPDPVFSSNAQTLTYVYDLAMFELDPDDSLEFGQFSPDPSETNYTIGTHARFTGQQLPFGVTVIDRIGVSGWQLSVQQNDQFKGDVNQLPLTDASLWFKNLQIQDESQAGIGNTQFNTIDNFTLTPGATPKTLVKATTTATQLSQSVPSQTWRINFGDATTGGNSVGLNVPTSTARSRQHYSTTLTWTADQLP